MKLVCSFRDSTIDMLNMCLCAWHEYIKYISTYYVFIIYYSHRLVFYISESINSIAIYHGFFETVSSPNLLRNHILLSLSWSQYQLETNCSR